MKLNIHLLLCSKRHYIDEIEYPPSPICGEKPQFESNVTSFQFRQNASARWWPLATTSPRRFGGDNVLHEECNTDFLEDERIMRYSKTK